LFKVGLAGTKRRGRNGRGGGREEKEKQGGRETTRRE
jgi:hypothetical protein